MQSFPAVIFVKFEGNAWSQTMDSKVSLNLIKHWQALCNDIVFTDIAPLLIQNKIITLGDYENIKSQPEKAETESLLLTLLKKKESVLLRFVETLERDYSWLAEKIREGDVPEHGRDEIDATPITQMDSREHFDNDTSAEEERDIRLDCNNLSSISRSNCLNNRVNNKGGKWERRRIIKTRVKNRLRSKIPNSETVISSSTDLVKQQKNEEITDEVITILRKCSLLSKSWTTIAHSLGLTDRVHDIRFRVILYNEHLSMCIVYLIKDWLEMFPKEATLSRLIEVLRSENFNKIADELSEKLYSKPVTVTSKIQ